MLSGHIFFATFHDSCIVGNFRHIIPRNILVWTKCLRSITRQSKGAARLSLYESQYNITAFDGKIAFLATEPSDRSSLGDIHRIPADRTFLPTVPFFRDRVIVVG
jgi:hypothetical protein